MEYGENQGYQGGAHFCVFGGETLHNDVGENVTCRDDGEEDIVLPGNTGIPDSLPFGTDEISSVESSPREKCSDVCQKYEPKACGDCFDIHGTVEGGGV